MSQRKNFILRIDPALWKEIERWAEEEFRSVNGQIEYLLKRAVVARGRKVKEEAEETPANGHVGRKP